MKQRAALCAALAAALLCLATPARADKETIALEYAASTGCPDRKQFVERVRTFTTKAEIVSDDGAPRRKFGVQVERSGNVVRGDLTIDDRGAKTTRHVSGATCDEVISALALATAIAVDPDALGGAAPDEQQPKPAVTEPPSAPPPTPLKRAVPPGRPAPPPLPRRMLPRPQPAPPALYLSLGARVGDAIAPFPKLEGTAELGFTYLAPVELYLGAAYGPEQENSQVRVMDWLAWFGAGYRLFELEPFSVLTLASVELGQVQATGLVAPPFLTVRPPWLAVDVGLGGRVSRQMSGRVHPSCYSAMSSPRKTGRLTKHRKCIKLGSSVTCWAYPSACIFCDQAGRPWKPHEGWRGRKPWQMTANTSPRRLLV
jgi:hypothetical protein